MDINEIKEKLDFYTDAIYQKGFDSGWNVALEEMEQLSDRLWNNGDSATGQSIRDVLNRLRGKHDVA